MADYQSVSLWGWPGGGAGGTLNITAEAAAERGVWLIRAAHLGSQEGATHFPGEETTQSSAWGDSLVCEMPLKRGTPLTPLQ